MQVDSINALRNYLSFIGAKDFCYSDDANKKFPSTGIEKLTNRLLTPLQVPLDFTLKNFNRPLFVAALGVVGIAALTIGIYPDRSFQTLQVVCSPFFNLQPWKLKYGAYLLSETMITSLMVRTIARLNTTPLVNAWNAKEISPIHLGTQILPSN